MFGVRFSSSTSSSNYPLEITALTVVSPFSGGHSKLQHFRTERRFPLAAAGCLAFEAPRLVISAQLPQLWKSLQCL